MSEIVEMVNSTVAGVREFELSSPDSRGNEPDPPAQPDHALTLGDVIQKRDATERQKISVSNAFQGRSQYS